MKVEIEHGGVHIVLDPERRYRFFNLMVIETRKVVCFIQEDPYDENEPNLPIDMVTIHMTEDQYQKLVKSV